MSRQRVFKAIIANASQGFPAIAYVEYLYGTGHQHDDVDLPEQGGDPGAAHVSGSNQPWVTISGRGQKEPLQVDAQALSTQLRCIQDFGHCLQAGEGLIKPRLRPYVLAEVDYVSGL